MSKLFAELRRRKVFQTFVPYLGFVWLILQVVSVVTPMFNLSPMVSTLVAVVLFAGMPVMLYLSWYFDFTIEGLVAIPDAKTDQVSSFGLFRWIILIVITLGSGALGYRYFSQVKIEFAKQNDGISQTFIANSIAVLPFKDTSADQDQAFLAQGLAEEITSLLGRTNGLKVAASSSTSILADKGLDPVTIAKRLDVATILTGSVRSIGDQLKIRVELINATDAKVLWSETFSRKFSDIFSVENEIARSTVNMLQDTYIETGSLTNSASTKSTDAYVIYLKGREQYRKQTTESMKAARKLFEQAIGLDPEYAQAYVALADTIVMLAEGIDRFGVLDPKIAATLAEQYLEKAIIRNANMPEAYAVLGYVSRLRQNFDEAIDRFNKALSLNPNLAVVYTWKFLLYRDINNALESFESAKMAYSLDPISIATQHNYGFALTLRGHFDSSKKIFEQLIMDHPDSPLGYAGLADIEFSLGHNLTSLEYWKTSYELSKNNNDYRNGYIGGLLSLGLTNEVRQITDDSFYEPNILVLEGKYEELLNLMKFKVDADPDNSWIKFETGWYETLVGNRQVGINYLLSAKSDLQKENIFSMPWCSPAIEIAWALKKENKVNEFKEFFVHCKQNMLLERKNNIQQHELDYLAARLAALDNQPEEAIKNLILAVKNGWREWWTEKDPLFIEIKNMPEFQQQIDIIKDDLALQKSEALKLFAE